MCVLVLPCNSCLQVSLTPLKQLEPPDLAATLQLDAAPLQLAGPEQQQQPTAANLLSGGDAHYSSSEVASGHPAAELQVTRDAAAAGASLAAAAAAACSDSQLQDEELHAGLALWDSAGAPALDDEQGLSGDADQLLATLRANLEVRSQQCR
jgi:hypothetical protein